MSISLDTNSLAQQIKDATLSAVSTIKETVVGESTTADDHHRVFVGNLSFETTADEVKSFFSEAGDVVSISLPTRRNYRTKSTQPSGIAFVGYGSDAEAEKAVESFNGKTLGERDINVAIARPVPQKKEKAKAGKSTENSPEEVQTAETSGEPKTEKKKRVRKPKASSDKTENTNGEVTEDASTKPATKVQTPRAPKERGPPADGVPSKITLFVAGLDHKTTDAELKELFAEFSPTSAHVALRPIPRFMVKKLAEKGEQRLGRGFGFVTFKDNEAQSAALKAMDGHKVGDRELAVKVAVDSPEKTEAANADTKTAPVESATAVEATA